MEGVEEVKPCAIALPALIAFCAVQGCAPIYETRTSLVVSRQPIAAGDRLVVQRRAVLTSTNLDGEEVVVRVVEHKGCRQQVVERRVVEERIERELDKPIFGLEVTAAASVPVAMLAAAAIDNGDSSSDGATGEHFDVGLEPVFGGAVLVLGGVALTAVIVDALAARDETKRRTETHPIGFVMVDCGASPASGVPVELVLSDGSRHGKKTDASGVARIGIATNRPNLVVDIVVAGKLAARFLVPSDTTSGTEPP
jgi:hypothetical protein